MKHFLPLIVLVLTPCCAAAGDIERIWLTHKTNDPSRIVVNWMTGEPGDSVVRFGLTAEYGEMVRVDGSTTLKHRVRSCQCPLSLAALDCDDQFCPLAFAAAISRRNVSGSFSSGCHLAQRLSACRGVKWAL